MQFPRRNYPCDASRCMEILGSPSGSVHDTPQPSRIRSLGGGAGIVIRNPPRLQGSVIDFVLSLFIPDIERRQGPECAWNWLSPTRQLDPDNKRTGTDAPLPLSEAEPRVQTALPLQVHISGEMARQGQTTFELRCL